MISTESALERLERCLENSVTFGEELFEACNAALHKEVGRRPIRNSLGYFECTVCKHYICDYETVHTFNRQDGEDFRYCDHCGNKLDWDFEWWKESEK